MRDSWYHLKKEEVFERLKTNVDQGLGEEEVKRRLEEHGPNELIEKGAKSPWKILWEQLTGVMVVILIIAAVISLFLREYTDAIVILVIVVLNSVLGFSQEYRAEKAMAALKKMAVPQVTVRRGGHIRNVPAQSLVPGDIVLLDAGDAVPADGRVVESVNLRVQEAVLTGESEPVEKTDAVLDGENLTVGDRRNMVHMGTITTYGRGTVVVTGTGMNTELGHIAEMLQTVGQEQTPLQRRLGQLGTGLAIAALVIVAIVFGLGLLRGEDLRLMFQTAISMAVAAVPEGLPAVVTIALALGAQRMLRRNALIRKLPAVETLGSVTVICSDKTGTLTQNQMTVMVLDVAGNTLKLQEELRDFSPALTQENGVAPVVKKGTPVGLLLLGGMMANDAVLETSEEEPSRFTAVGDPTEGALVIAAAQTGLWKAEIEAIMPRVAEVPFDSERKRMTTVHEFQPERLEEKLDCLDCILPVENRGEYIAFTKGSVDGLLEISDRVQINQQVEPMSPEWRQRIVQANNELAESGMRVLGVAYRLVSGAEFKSNLDAIEDQMTFVGMFGMIDPARPEVQDAIQVAVAAGMRPIMITGDHPLTALHIARELGMTEGGQVVTGADLAQMSVEALKDQIYDTAVYARVSPEHKLKIIQAFQEKGEIVAMTGDGVNDAPALKRADIGVAMGITGTDVTKEASDIVLLDDNFATIVAAVEEGRRIYDNIRRFIRYALTSNAGEVWVMLLAPFIGLPFPMTPIQILWINLVTDGLPGLALSIEPAEPDTMRRPPNPPNENFFARGMARDILWIGLWMGLVSLGVGFWAFNQGIEAWQTMVFTTLTLAQMGNALAIRSQRYSLFQIGVMSNPMLLGAVVLTLALQMAIIYIPFLQPVFRTQALSLTELAISVIASSLVFVAIELFKWVLRRREHVH